MKDQEIFFALIRAAVWTDSEGRPTQDRMDELAALIPVGYDWGPMIEAFRQHALLGVVANVILALPEDKRPSNEPTQTPDGRSQAGLQDQLLTHVAALVRQRFRMRQVIPELFAELEKVSHPVLLKGEGLAELYPKSAHRSVGDIDVYVGPRDFESACVLIDQLNGITPDPNLHYQTDRFHMGSSHHYETTYQGLELEIHHAIANNYAERFDLYGQLGLLYNRWAERTYRPEDCIDWPLAGTTIHLPPVQFNVFYIFAHLSKHLYNEGGALRQMVDWALYLHCYAGGLNGLNGSKGNSSNSSNPSNYSKSELYRILKASHHLYPWQVLSGILHHQLGLPKDEIPFYNERLAKKSQGEVLTTLLAAGNFGWYLPKEEDHTDQLSHGSERTSAVFRQMWNRCRKGSLLFPYFARYYFLQALLLGFRARLKALFRR